MFHSLSQLCSIDSIHDDEQSLNLKIEMVYLG